MTERLTAVEWGPRGDWEQWQRAVLRRARRVTVGLRALLGARTGTTGRPATYGRYEEILAPLKDVLTTCRPGAESRQARQS